MTFHSQTIVRFAHVDPAGIVFYPRYFEMLNAAVEDMFAEQIGVDFATMHLDRKIGVPTVNLQVDFQSASRLGDVLDFAIEVEKVGGSSATLNVAVTCAGAPRLSLRVVLVCMDLVAGKSMPWPDDMRPAVTATLAA
ncbi:4-hydroxybenzoyl-CoA thioesterase [Sphingomonas zeicaulis]|uniref:acyl-CoA thioesterase n=1 Tax=Sphingomonas zeicaulis TaxID=1632740 RepID=UPI003D21EF01